MLFRVSGTGKKQSHERLRWRTQPCCKHVGPICFAEKSLSSKKETRCMRWRLSLDVVHPRRKAPRMSTQAYCTGQITQHGEKLNACNLPTCPPRTPHRPLPTSPGQAAQRQNKPHHLMVCLCSPHSLRMPPLASTTRSASRRWTTAGPSSSAASCGAGRFSTPWPNASVRPARAAGSRARSRCPRSSSRDFLALPRPRSTPWLAPARRNGSRPGPRGRPGCRRHWRRRRRP